MSRYSIQKAFRKAFYRYVCDLADALGTVLKYFILLRGKREKEKGKREKRKEKRGKRKKKKEVHRSLRTSKATRLLPRY